MLSGVGSAGDPLTGFGFCVVIFAMIRSLLSQQLEEKRNPSGDARLPRQKLWHTEDTDGAQITLMKSSAPRFVGAAFHLCHLCPSVSSVCQSCSVPRPRKCRKMIAFAETKG